MTSHTTRDGYLKVYYAGLSVESNYICIFQHYVSAASLVATFF